MSPKTIRTKKSPASVAMSSTDFQSPFELSRHRLWSWLGRFLFLTLLLIHSAGSAEDLKALGLEGWSVIRPDAKEMTVTSDGILRLRTQPGRIWAGEGARNLVLSEPRAGARAMELTAKVELHDPEIKYEQAGVLCYVNDDWFVKFIVEHIDGDPWIVSAMESPDGRRLLSKERLSAMREELKIETSGAEVMCRYRESADSEWKQVSTAEIPISEERRLGFFTQDGPKDKTNWASFLGILFKTASTPSKVESP